MLIREGQAAVKKYFLWQHFSDIMNNRYKDDKDEIYDVLKDNPRWSEEKAETGSNTAQSAPIKESDSEISDVSAAEKGTGDYLYEDKASELRAKNAGAGRDDMTSEEYLNEWQNEETLRKNEQEFQHQLDKRRNPSFQFNKSNTKKITLALWIIAAVIILLSLFCIASDIYSRKTGGYKPPQHSGADSETIGADPQPTLDETEEYVDENGRYTVEGVAKAVRPSIVEIYCYKNMDSYKSETPTGTGSGIIISEDGYIVTNTHVLEGCEYFEVITDDETKYIAEIAGKDSKTDIAVVKIDAYGLKSASIGDSDKVVVGEEVVAIGNPAGLSGTVTNGIVSALNRQIKSDSTGFEMQCIQTNAAISPGNSGGALVNMYGQVIGITSSKYGNASFEGLGFAITINQALPVINQLVQNGYVDGRTKMGIKFYSLNDEVIRNHFADEFGFAVPDAFEGIWITQISEDCDISESELMVNDFIVRVEGQKVRDYDELNKILENHDAGDKLTADCVRFDDRGGKYEFTIEFTLNADTSGDY